ncbi:unnamed protein product [Sphagnum troendelagicum]
MASTILMRRQGASFSQFPSWCCSKLSFSTMQAAAAPPVMFNKWVLGRRPFLHFKLSRTVACAADTRIPSNTVKAAHSTSAAVSHVESCALQKAAHSTNAAVEEEVKKENKCSSVQQLSTTTIITPTLVPDLFLESSSILDDEMEDILETEDDADDDDDDSVLESAAIVVGVAEEEVMEVSPTGNVCIVGVDPDVSGALAVIKSEDQGAAAEVLDVPCVKVAVGKTMRRRHDTCSIAALVHQLNAPQGSIAYVEQAQPFPKDGKQGWYSTGFGYGAWVGILVASGFRVVPVRAQAWKKAAGICGREYTKDDSRALASMLFPELSPLLKRKKDHGRADALLIARFGKKSLETGES